jgi:hypothetical protein
MGFDLHGLNPVEHKASSKYPTLASLKGSNLAERNRLFKRYKELESCYWEEYDAREDDNPGRYFRANVWWWRTMWMYVYFNCDDFLTEDDYNEGQSNGGHEISASKASAIAKKMFEHIESGEAAGFEKHHKKVMDEARENNEKLEKEGAEKYGEDWDWAADYPFEVGVLREFAEFCSQSGGFSIC